MGGASRLNVAITGTTSGIGLRALQHLAAAGHRVFALNRSVSRSLPGIEAANATAAIPAEVLEADLSEPASVRSAAAQLASRIDHLDVLIHNAAVFDQTVRTARFNSVGHELFWATNHLGPYELTARASGLLAAAPAPRVLFVASKGLITMPWIRIRFEALDSASWYSPTRAYYHAKLAQLMTAVSLAGRAQGRATVSCIRVPAVRLDPERLAALPLLLRMLYAPKNRRAASPERLGEAYVQLATGGARTSMSAADGASGLYVDEDLRPVKLPRFALDPAARERLWEISQAASGEPSWAW